MPRLGACSRLAGGHRTALGQLLLKALPGVSSLLSRDLTDGMAGQIDPISALLAGAEIAGIGDITARRRSQIANCDAVADCGNDVGADADLERQTAALIQNEAGREFIREYSEPNLGAGTRSVGKCSLTYWRFDSGEETLSPPMCALREV
jgi:hypothetical protein